MVFRNGNLSSGMALHISDGAYFTGWNSCKNTWLSEKKDCGRCKDNWRGNALYWDIWWRKTYCFQDNTVRRYCGKRHLWCKRKNCGISHRNGTWTNRTLESEISETLYLSGYIWWGYSGSKIRNPYCYLWCRARLLHQWETCHFKRGMYSSW